jgi:gliding motility-associated-like protein
VNDGWARVNVSGGIDHLPYSYMWNDPMNTTTESVGSLAIGWYNVAITDANGCMIIDSVYIPEPFPITAQFNIISEAWYHGEMISCAGAADGAIWAQASGGRRPYTYDWIGTVTSNDTIFGLPAGMHQVRISDMAGCDTILTVTLTEPLALNAIGIIERNVSCYNLNDGRINLEPRGGVSPYTYRWSSESLPADLTTEDIDNLYAGDYILTLWDMNLCRMDTSFTITEPDELKAEIIVDTIPFCPDSYDGMIHVDVTGGTEPYDIWWISQNTNDPVLYGLGEGIYVVQVDDINNCGLVGDSVVLVADANNCLEIPTAISPNGDGKNDVWEIHGIEYYPDAIIEIYNRWGDLVFRSDRGYNTKFDGMYRGKHLPVDSYHYIINLHNGRVKPIVGNITIIL